MSEKASGRTGESFTGLLICVLVCGLVRAAWLARFPADPTGPVDAEGFHLLAVNMLAGRGFAIGWAPPFCPTAIRPPLYPLFLAGSYVLLGAAPAHAVPVQLLLEALTTALVVRLGREVGGAKVGWLSGLLYAFNGTTQRYTGYLLSEALLLPLLAAAVLTTVRGVRQPSSRGMALAGLFWGLALLTKPNVQFLALAVGVMITLAALRARTSPPATQTPLRVADRVRRGVVFWGVLAAVLFPWTLRNRLVFGRWILSTAFEENLARVSAVATMAEVRGVRAEPWTETWEYLYGQLVETTATRYGWDTAQGAELSCDERNLRHNQLTTVARETVIRHLGTYAPAHLRGVVLSLLDPGHRLWYRVLTGRSWESTGVVPNIWQRMAWSLERWAVGDAIRAFWQERVTRLPPDAALIWWGLVLARAAVWGLGLRGAWRLRHQPPVALALVGAVAYILLLPGPIAYDRFYLPAIPPVVVLVASGALGFDLQAGDLGAFFHLTHHKRDEQDQRQVDQPDEGQHRHLVVEFAHNAPRFAEEIRHGDEGDHRGILDHIGCFVGPRS